MSRDKELEIAAVKELEGKLRNGAITRREFLGRASVLGVAATTATSIWNTALAAPKRGGHQIQGLRGGATSDSLDPEALFDTHAISCSWQIRNNLSEVLANGDVIGELAESWEPSADASEWRFNLRKGVEFHNGKSLDAQDVIWSLNLHRGESKSGGAGIVASVEDITADGKDTVVVKLQEGNADFPTMLADYHMVIGIDGMKGADWDNDGVGTGPFTLEEWEPGLRSTTKRSPNYFKDGPWFDSVENLNIADQSARVNALRSEEVHAIEEPDLKTLHLLEKAPGIKVLEVGGTRQYTIPMRTDTAPFDNNDVRLALKYGINRQALVDTVLRGHGSLGNDHPIGRSQRYFDPSIPQREYDADQAKFHIKKAGMDKLSVDLYTADVYTGANDAAVLYKEQATGADIDLNVIIAPTDGYWSDVWMNKPFSMCYWSGRPTSDWIFSMGYYSQASWNDSFWTHDGFDKLLFTARAELDSNKRAEMYSDMQQIVRDEGGVVIPVFPNWVCAMSDKIGTPDPIAGNWAFDGLKNFERWWFT